MKPTPYVNSVLLSRCPFLYDIKQLCIVHLSSVSPAFLAVCKLKQIFSVVAARNVKIMTVVSAHTAYKLVESLDHCTSFPDKLLKWLQICPQGRSPSFPFLSFGMTVDAKAGMTAHSQRWAQLLRCGPLLMPRRML